MNPNRITLFQLAEHKLQSNLQAPAEAMSRIRLLDLPVFYIEDGMAKIFVQTDEAGEAEHQASDWTGLAVSLIDGVTKAWFICKDEDTSETEFLCLGTPNTVDEALIIALDAIHQNMIHWQSQTLREIA